MLSSFLLPLLILISPIASLSLLVTDDHQQPLSNINNGNVKDGLKTHFRDIQSKDLPAITKILVEAFSPSATWHYLMPDLQHHKHEVWSCLHDQVEHAWKTRNTTRSFGKVITVFSPPSSSDETQRGGDQEEEEEEEEIPVSFSLWSIRHRPDSPSNHPFPSSFSPPSILASTSTSTSPCPLPPGTNLTRAQDFTRQNAIIEQKYFTKPYAHQFYLALLATHPSWDGHGFAARHVQWGQDLSLELEPEMPVTLLASPAGYPLYDSLGFDSVKNATMPMLDWPGELWFEVMRWGWDGGEVKVT